MFRSTAPPKITSFQVVEKKKYKQKKMECRVSGQSGILEPHGVYNVNHNVHMKEIRAPISNMV